MALTDIVARHPRGTMVLCLVEMLERFSFYAMSGLLALFLVGSQASGGFGWSKIAAIQTYGIYVGLLWLTPLLGGWIGDRVTGARNAVIGGGALISLGQLMMLTPAIIPRLAAQFTGLPVAQVLVSANVPLGEMAPSPAIRHALAVCLGQLLGRAPTPAQSGWMITVYIALGLMFFGGLALLAIGNGMLKPNITVMLGNLYRTDDPYRDEAFTLFYMGINAGAVLAALIAGTISEKFGWSLGFGISGVLVLVGTLALAASRGVFPPGFGQRLDATAPGAGRRPKIPRNALLRVVLLMIFASLFWAAFMQTFGLLSLFAYSDVDRSVGSFTIPAVWFASLTPFFLITVGPFFQWGLHGLRRIGREPGTVARFVGGLLAAAIAFAVLATAIAQQHGHDKISFVWLLLFYLMLAGAELSLSPAGNAMAARGVSPATAGRLMSIWFLCYGLGSFLSSLLGSLSAVLSIPAVLTLLALLLLAAGIALFTIRGLLDRLAATHGGE